MTVRLLTVINLADSLAWHRLFVSLLEGKRSSSARHDDDNRFSHAYLYFSNKCTLLLFLLLLLLLLYFPCSHYFEAEAGEQPLFPHTLLSSASIACGESLDMYQYIVIRMLDVNRKFPPNFGSSQR